MWFADVYNPVQAGSIDGTDQTPHDAAVHRATFAHYEPPKHLSTDARKTIFVGRLNYETTEEGLRHHFERYGKVVNVKLIHNMVTGTSRGYGFVTFERSHEARKAYESAHRTVLDDHMLLVDYERSRVMRGWIPRRLGGGFGGRKESGQLRFGARDKPFRWPMKAGRDDENRLRISPEQRKADNWRYYIVGGPRSEDDRQRDHRDSGYRHRHYEEYRRRDHRYIRHEDRHRRP